MRYSQSACAAVVSALRAERFGHCGPRSRRRIAAATLQQKQDLAAVIHLCGAAVGDAYAKRNFRLAAGQRCGDHDLRDYIAQVNVMKRVFVRLAGAG